MWTIEMLLEKVASAGGSDLILTAGVPPQIKVLGNLHALDDRPLAAPETEALGLSILNETQRNTLFHNRSVDLSKGFQGLNRFRFNVFYQRGAIALVARLIPYRIPSFGELGLPPIVKQFALCPHGLVLVTGPAGSGKSTTLAAMIEHINTQRSAHIICLEDPIEYLHTQDTTHAINRIVDIFPPSHQQQVYTQLSMVLSGIISQALLVTADQSRRVLACEVLQANNAIGNLIRERQLQQIYSVIQTGKSEGMVTMNESLRRLVAEGKIDQDLAMERSPRPRELARMLGVARREEPTGYAEGDVESRSESWNTRGGAE